MRGRNSANGAALDATVGGYVRGLLLALGLTVASFLLVMRHAVDGLTLVWALAGLALMQLVVHLVCFLHLGRSSNQRWNRVALIFAGIFVVLVVGGSVWIMQHLNHNMMPMAMVG